MSETVPQADSPAATLTVLYKAEPGQMCRLFGVVYANLNSQFPAIGARANNAILPVESNKVRTEKNKENEGF